MSEKTTKKEYDKLVAQILELENDLLMNSLNDDPYSEDLTWIEEGGSL